MHGFLSFQVQSKLNSLKHSLRDAYNRVPLLEVLKNAEDDLLQAQSLLHAFPLDPGYASMEVRAASVLKRTKQDYATYIQQLGKMQWLNYGDDNSKFFHQSIRQRRIINTISSLRIEGRMVSDPNLIQKAFPAFYSNILCSTMLDRQRINMQVIHIGLVLSESDTTSLNLCFSPQEIKDAFWSIPDVKAPGLDGYNSKFYKAAWPIVGDDLVVAI